MTTTTVTSEPATDAAIAEELAEVLMRKALSGGPLARIGELTRLLRILRMVVRIVTERRDRSAYSAGAVWPQRRLAKLAGVNTSTMQGWCESGARHAPMVTPGEASADADSWLSDQL